MMYPDLEIARNRIAELHHLAERADLALAIRRARRARQDRSGHATPARPSFAARSPTCVPAPPDPATAGHPGRNAGTAPAP
jgi:hypothetical protein